MDLIKFGEYTPPAPTQYDVQFGSVDGENSQVEDGTRYTERIREEIPNISVSWTNITTDEATEIIKSITGAFVEVTYFFGTERFCKMQASEPKLTLTFMDKSTDFWTLSFSLEG